MCANFKDRRLRDRELRHKKKTRKTAILGSKIYQIAYNPKTT